MWWRLRPIAEIARMAFYALAGGAAPWLNLLRSEGTGPVAAGPQPFAHLDGASVWENRPMSMTETALALELRRCPGRGGPDAVAAGNLDLAAGLAGPLQVADTLGRSPGAADRRRALGAVIAALGPAFDAETLADLDEFLSATRSTPWGQRRRAQPLAELKTDDAVEWLISTRPSRRRSCIRCRYQTARRSSRAGVPGVAAPAA